MLATRLLLGLILMLSACASLPRVPLPDQLDGVWHYQGGEPSNDRELHFSTWPESRLEIDAARGIWRSYRDPSRSGRDTLYLAARVTAVDGNVVTLQPEKNGRAFQVYWRIREGRLEYWWGVHPDWLKPFVIYVR